MKYLVVPTRKKVVGFVPNMFAFIAHSPTALGDYLILQNRTSYLNKKNLYF